MDMKDEVLTALGPKKSKRHQLDNGWWGKEQVQIRIVMTERDQAIILALTWSWVWGWRQVINTMRMSVLWKKSRERNKWRTDQENRPGRRDQFYPLTQTRDLEYSRIPFNVWLHIPFSIDSTTLHATTLLPIQVSHFSRTTTRTTTTTMQFERVQSLNSIPSTDRPSVSGSNTNNGESRMNKRKKDEVCTCMTLPLPLSLSISISISLPLANYHLTSGINPALMM